LQQSNRFLRFLAVGGAGLAKVLAKIKPRAGQVNYRPVADKCRSQL